jgi:hypothetical protein
MAVVSVAVENGGTLKFEDTSSTIDLETLLDCVFYEFPHAVSRPEQHEPEAIVMVDKTRHN